MSAMYPPMGLGDTVLSADGLKSCLADLGNIYEVGRFAVRLVRSTGVDATPAGKAKIAVLSAGQRTFYVDKSAVANSYLAAGICAQGQAALAAGDFFLIIVGGKNIQAIMDDTSAVVGDPLGVASVGSDGKIQGIATATTLVSVFDPRILINARIGILEKVATAASAAVFINIDRRL